MRAIPQKLKRELKSDSWYSRCCITGQPQVIEKIDWHHNFIFAGRQVNEKWCILPLAQSIHRREKERAIKERLDWIMLNRIDEKTMERYSKLTNLSIIKATLNNKFGKWNPWSRYEI